PCQRITEILRARGRGNRAASRRLEESPWRAAPTHDTTEYRPLTTAPGETVQFRSISLCPRKTSPSDVYDRRRADTRPDASAQRLSMRANKVEARRFNALQSLRRTFTVGDFWSNSSRLM